MLGEKCIDFHKNRIKCFANMQMTRIKVFGEKRLKKGFAKISRVVIFQVARETARQLIVCEII